MTHRMTQLETKELIERVANEHDARSKLVKLTKKGEALVSRAVDEHVENELDILSNLDESEQKSLDNSLKALLIKLEAME